MCILKYVCMYVSLSTGILYIERVKTVAGKNQYGDFRRRTYCTQL